MTILRIMGDLPDADVGDSLAVAGVRYTFVNDLLITAVLRESV